MARLHTLIATALVATFTSLAAHAAEAVPPADPSKPVTEVRVGGSRADAAFRNARQRNAEDYRAARKACTAGARAERGTCMKAARDKLKQDNDGAKAAHDVAR